MRSHLVLLASLLSACGGGSGSSPGGPAVPPFDGKVPPETCTPPVQARNTNTPTRVVGTGAAASCTESELRAAVQATNAAGGGIITFSCGAAPALITVGSQLVVTKDTTIDGGGKITLSGGDASRILYLDSDYNRATPRLWVQNLTFQQGKSARGADDTASGGAAIYRDGGSLTVVNCVFLGNHAPDSGPDLAGGAIYGFGGGETVIVGSTFIGNSASDGGAVGSLNGDLTVVNSTFTDNHALGTGGNPGKGGCGGAIYQDGGDEVTTLCGVTIRGNSAGHTAGGVFRVSNSHDGTMSLDLSAVDANEVTDSDGGAGGLYLEGLALTVTRSTISRNSAPYNGGAWIARGTLDLVDSTVAGNTATLSNGGGLWLGYSPPGRILNCTIAGNHAPGGSAGAIFSAAPEVDGQPVLQNTIVSGNDARWSDGCQESGLRLGDGGGNLEWSADGTRCAAGATSANPLLSALALAAAGDATEVMVPASTSPARRLGTSGCPTVDQRGKLRSTPCTAGAVEVP